MKQNKFNPNKGQSMVLFALGLFVLLAVAVLVLDGAQTYVNRRTAQAAADAGAIAGAYEYCAGGGSTAALVTAENYAVNENGATSANAWIDSDEVVVEATVSQNTYFGGIFGINQTNVTAIAASGCFTPGLGSSVLPVAWSCRPPVGASASPDCQLKALDWLTEMQPLITGIEENGDPVALINVDGIDYVAPHDFVSYTEAPLPQIYIIMDSNKVYDDVAETCVEIDPINGEMICDIDGDGEIDILAGGNRAWLNLDNQNGAGSSTLSDWICNGVNADVFIHTWLEGLPGTKSSVYKTVEDDPAPAGCGKIGEVVHIPVFNAMCPKGMDPLDTDCQDAAHLNFPLDPGESDFIPPDNSYNPGSYYFHISGFATYYVTCVADKKNECPGHTAAVNAGILDHNTPTIEGYFVTGYPSGGSGGTGGVDMGNYIFSLTQ
jgi:hypothetical protein